MLRLPYYSVIIVIGYKIGTTTNWWVSVGFLLLAVTIEINAQIMMILIEHLKEKGIINKKEGGNNSVQKT